MPAIQVRAQRRRRNYRLKVQFFPVGVIPLVLRQFYFSLETCHTACFLALRTGGGEGMVPCERQASARACTHLFMQAVMRVHALLHPPLAWHSSKWLKALRQAAAQGLGTPAIEHKLAFHGFPTFLRFCFFYNIIPSQTTVKDMKVQAEVNKLTQQGRNWINKGTLETSKISTKLNFLQAEDSSFQNQTSYHLHGCVVDKPN